MKVGVITFWDSHENYGQLLQAYALQRFLIKQGHDVFLIKYDRKQIDSKTAVKAKVWTIRKLLRKLKKKKGRNKTTSFDTFRDQYLKFSEPYESYKSLLANPPEADFYITGSDQVWNYEFLRIHEPFFLQFGEAKKLSYAASFAQKELPVKISQKYGVFLKKFHGVSVREISGLELCKGMGINNAQLVPDPTLLLTKDDWNELGDFKSIPRENKSQIRILTYLITTRSSEINDQLVSYISDSDEYEVTMATIRDNNDQSYTIKEWLNLIWNADLVATNSFHGIVFSILLNRNFVALPTVGNQKGMNERLYTLLGKLNLENHLLEDFKESNFKKIIVEGVKWEEVNSAIENWRRDGSEFLQLAKY